MTDADRLVQTRPTGHGRARGLVSRRSGPGVHARTYAPHDDLTRWVASYWTGAWDLRGRPDHVTQLLADPCVNVVVEVGDGPAGARVVGVWTRLWTRRLTGRGRVWGVKLRPGAARRFLPIAAHALTNRITPWTDVWPEVTAGLERLQAASPTDEDAFETLATWLRTRARTGNDARIDVAIALVDRVRTDPEVTTVERLAADTDHTVRQLQRLFRDCVGASPKWIIRRHRLQEAALRIERGEHPTFADLAAALDYADQAHFARDFKAATGMSPRAFAQAVATTPVRGHG